MCVYSMVIDHFAPKFPGSWILPETPPWLPDQPLPTVLPPIVVQPSPAAPFTPTKPPTLDELKELIRQFWEALEAAEKVDRLTGQPDCEDPEKAKLKDRVKALEARIAVLEKAPKAKKAAKRSRKPAKRSR